MEKLEKIVKPYASHADSIKIRSGHVALSKKIAFHKISIVVGEKDSQAEQSWLIKRKERLAKNKKEDNSLYESKT
ncbi:MAG: hypothetical protein HYW50_00420 [Candidatus Diapherotrites archaeon]|nr:hypothetical protein [Candidatus Diapherotrites archaeon]